MMTLNTSTQRRKGAEKTVGRLGLLLSATMAAVTAGCAVGPDYQRPETRLPAVYNDEAVKPAEAVNAEWWKLFKDPLLDKLVADALVNNADLQLALARVEEADALMRQAGASLLPEIDVAGSDTRSRVSTATSLPGTPPLVRESIKMGLSTSFELDFWGHLRRGRESMRAAALSSRHGRDTLALSIAGLVSQGYIALRSLDAQVAASRSSLETRDKALALVRERFESGLSGELDLRQAETARAAVASQTADLVQSRALAQHQLALLTGQMDLQVPPGSLQALPLPPVPPAGLPSTLLEARPDVRQAEENLVSAHARIGVAKAALFPTIALTGSLGGESAQLAGLFSGASKVWTAGPTLFLPLLDWGLRGGQLDQATAQQKEALASYQKTVQSAFKDVKDALVSLRQNAEKDEATAAQMAAAGKALTLSLARYEAGYSPYLETLDAQRTLNDASLAALRNRQARLAAAVDVFKALGGGWKEVSR